MKKKHSARRLIILNGLRTILLTTKLTESGKGRRNGCLERLDDSKENVCHRGYLSINPGL